MLLLVSYSNKKYHLDPVHARVPTWDQPELTETEANPGNLCLNVHEHVNGYTLLKYLALVQLIVGPLLLAGTVSHYWERASESFNAW